ncbi:hypothetical protein L5515_001690 [Caenorhabditis briggsae]|uniref:ARID domain-containing protein n=1 Tax=Caenorhabditis briggsae TaxID=6238 RepID=A0AAE9J396_CAEBR|nr:hypothetical protein L5515_001690 [Caenorhabditis briggsae]
MRVVTIVIIMTTSRDRRELTNTTESENMPGDDNAVGTETNEDKPTTSNASTTEEQTPNSEESHQNPQQRGEDADKYAASVAKVAHGGGNAKKDDTAVPPAPESTPPQQPVPPQPPQQQQYPPPPHHLPPQHSNVPPNSFAPPPGQLPPGQHPPPPAHHPSHPGMPPMDWRPPQGSEHQMTPVYPPGYPPYGMPPRHHPGYPPHPAYYPPPGAPYGYPPQMMRPPMMGPGDMVRMPPGPTPTEWAAQQQAQAAAAARGAPPKDGPNGNPATPSSSQPIPSPSASSIAEESLDEKPSGTKMPPQPTPQPQQIMSPMPPQTPHAQLPTPSSSATPATPSEAPKVSGKVLSRAELLEKLVGPVSHHNPPQVMHERRLFFERLIDFCERSGDPITMVPQVSKQSIDLHRLYIGVRGKGGFQQVTKEKYWKNLCTEANPDLAESSAAGYQLRKHYQKHLLMLECRETGKNPEDEVAYADKMKRQRKREPGGAAAAAVAAAAAAQQGPDQKPIQGVPGGSGPPPPPPGPPGAYPVTHFCLKIQVATLCTTTLVSSLLLLLERRVLTAVLLKVSTRGKRGGGGGGRSSKSSTRSTTPSTSLTSSNQLPAHIQSQLDIVPPPTQLHHHPDIVRMAHASTTWFPLPQHSSNAPLPPHQNGYLQVPQGSSGQPSPGATPQRSPSNYPMHGYPSGYPATLPSQQHMSRSEQFYRSRGFFPPGYPPIGNGAPGGPQSGPPQYSGHPGMDPNYMYYQQHGMVPPHPGHPGYPQMNAFSPGQYPGHQRLAGTPGGPPPGAQAMRAPMPQHMQEMDEQQRQWYAHQQAAAAHHHSQQQAAAQAAQAQASQSQQSSTPATSTTPAPQTAPSSQVAPASGSNTQPATPSASHKPPTPAGATSATLQVESAPTTGGSQSGSRAPSVGPGTSGTPDGASLPGVEPQPAVSSETSTPGEPGTSTPGETTPSTSAAPPTPGQPPQHSQSQVPPGPPGPPQHAGGYPGYPGYLPPGSMRPPAGFAPPPGAPYGYPGAPPPQTGYHPQHPQHPQHAQYLAWQQQQQQRYHQQQQQQQGPSGSQRPPYPYPSGPVPPGAQQNRLPPPPVQGAPSPSGTSASSGKQARYGTPVPPSRATAPTPQPLTSTMPVVPPSTSSQPTSSTGSYLANTLATPGPAQFPSSSSQPSQHTMSHQHQHQFPPGCIEATATAQVQLKRRKVYARELINATPRRLIMSLRSGLEVEAIWAINALNVLLYDDTNPQPSLQQMPGLVNVIVEHLYATLSILFPTEFHLTEPGKPIILDDSKEILDGLIKTEQNGGMKTMVDKMPVVPRKGSDKTAKFTMMSRNGLQVHFRDETIPVSLQKRVTREHTDKDAAMFLDESITSKYVAERNSMGLGGGLAERIATRLRDKLLHEKTRPRPVFSKYLGDDETEKDANLEDKIIKEEVLENGNEVLLMRGAKPEELSDCKHEVELALPRPIALSPKSKAMEDLAHRALALSNILRGFSFVPGSDALMARNEALLFIIGRFMRLNVNERKIVSKRPKIVLDEDELKNEPKTLTEDEKRAKEKSVLDDVDATRAQMIETANQLRDDAFVMLTHMSVSLNLYELPDPIAYPIYDGLLRWAVSRVPEATDSSALAPVSPRDYSLEIMCKMVVIERNVDMFLSTGSWSRVEQFVHILSRLLTMNEETHYREFAIVILNALCIASEAVCYICAMETNTIAHLILFIDSADQNMHQVMQAHGMAALRDNPELMGTSVGMLRRAASMLRLLVKVPKSYKIYLKHQTRLLQFTMSQLMDSRVAGMVADTLYEIQEYVKEFGEDVPEPLKITYSEGYQPNLMEEKEATTSTVEIDKLSNVEKTDSPKTENALEASTTPSDSIQGNGTVECETNRPSSSEDIVSPYENNHKNEEEDLKKDTDEGESCDGYESDSLRLSQKRSAAALIDEQSRSPPSAKRTCLSNGFDKSKSSVSTNGTLVEAQNDGAMTTAVA